MCFPTTRLFCTCQHFCLGPALVSLIYLGSDLVFLQGFPFLLIKCPYMKRPLYLLVGIGRYTKSCHGPTSKPSGLRKGQQGCQPSLSLPSGKFQVKDAFTPGTSFTVGSKEYRQRTWQCPKQASDIR